MHIVILVSSCSKKEAQKISVSLIKAKLAACVNIVDKVDSVFFWEHKVQKAKEFLLIIKSTKAKFIQITKLIKSLHRYKVPEIIGLPIIVGDHSYLRWIDAALR